MKKIVIRNVKAVGMHHYGRRELDLYGTYTVAIEPDNRYDSYAVAIYDGPRKVANLKRDCARVIFVVISENKSQSRYFLRPLDKPDVRSRRIGPEQSCAVVFKCLEDHVGSVNDLVSRQRLSGVYVKVMELPNK